MSPKNKALLTSFLRVLFATALAAYLEIGKKPLDLRLDDLENFFNAIVGALALTAFNYFRAGETRFGVGSQDIGMGGADVLEPPDGKVQTPDGPVDPAAAGLADDPPIVVVEKDDGSGQPVQTDNGPKPGDTIKVPVETFSGEMR